MWCCCRPAPNSAASKDNSAFLDPQAICPPPQIPAPGATGPPKTSQSHRTRALLTTARDLLRCLFFAFFYLRNWHLNLQSRLPYDCRVVLIVVTAISSSHSAPCSATGHRALLIDEHPRDPSETRRLSSVPCTHCSSLKLKVRRPERPEPRVAASPPTYDRTSIFRAVTDDPSPISVEQPDIAAPWRPSPSASRRGTREPSTI